MAASSNHLLGYIRRLAVHAEQTEATDAALLGRFLANRDDRAFAALVERHATLVFRVCWRTLRDTHDSQEAFQATFLVLARKAATVRPPEALPAWLHGVARRVAFKARAARFRRQRTERPLADATTDPRPDPLDEVASRDLLAIIDEEVRRLAERYRLPVILCCLEGRSLEEAAQQLGWTPGSVKGRLERGRARLHQRLARRGLTLSATLAAVELSRTPATAAVVGRIEPLIAAAMSYAVRRSPPTAAVSAQAIAAAGDIIRSMALVRLRRVAALLLAICLAAGGVLAYRHIAAPPRTDPESPASSSPSANPPSLVAPALPGKHGRSDRWDQMQVSGSVLDPQGRPFAGARLYIGYTYRRAEPDALAQPPNYPLHATSDAQGRFHFIVTRSELDERYLDASRPVVIAVAEGFGLDWADIGEAAANGTLRLRLVEDFPLEGRVLDAKRNPLAGVRVAVTEVKSDSVAGLIHLAQNLERSPTFKTCWGPLPNQPPHVMTTADGRFRLTGLGRDRIVNLALEGPTIPPTSYAAMTRPAAALPANLIRVRGVPIEHVSVVPRSIRGVVRDKATGQPVAGVKVSVLRNSSSTHTDREGRYELLVDPGLQRCVLQAQPASGQPYFAAAARPPLPPGLAPLTADFELIGGISLRGRVTEQTTGKPPRRAGIEYYPLFPNNHSAALTRLEHLQPASSAVLQSDGTYSLTVLPGPGVVLIAASPRDSYSSAQINERDLANLFGDGKNHSLGSRLFTAAGGPGGHGWSRTVDRYNALSLIQPDENAKSLTLDLTVQAARPLPGIVVGPDGQPLRGVAVIGLTSMPDAETLEGASFLVEGLNPQGTRELGFHHEEKRLGKALTIRGDQTKTLRVQLEPCGVVLGRMVDSSGQPVPEMGIIFVNAGKGLTARAETDDHGRFRATLVPHLPYNLGLMEPRRLSKPVHDLTVESGQTKDLGDVLLND